MLAKDNLELQQVLVRLRERERELTDLFPGTL